MGSRRYLGVLSFFSLLLLLMILVSILSPTSHDTAQFREATIESIQRAFAKNEISSTLLVQFYQDQISRQNPILRGVTEVNPDAESQAKKADEERRAGNLGTRLSGIPILIKDNIATKDKMNNTAGSFALLGSVVRKDAFVVKKLREAGAVILGKANLKEWSGFRSYSMPGGWSARSGQAKNPYNLSQEVCGSSSGSAISVAANFAMVALGTETDGSIVCPSSYNSVVGIKPTVNLTSRAGLLPISQRQDSVGPIARTVADAVHVLDVIVGRDYDDPGTIEASKHIPYGGYVQYLNPNGLNGKKLGILRNEYSFNYSAGSVENRTYEQLFQLTRAKGATLVDNLVIEHIDELFQNEMTVLLAELKRDLNSYLENLESSTMSSLADLIMFNKVNKRLESMDEFPQDMFIEANLTNGINETVQEALSNIEIFSRNGFEKVMKENELDALLYIGQKYAPFIGAGGYPTITVPAGYNSENMPLGICFGGLKYTEPTLIEIACAFEQATMRRRPPLDLPLIWEVTDQHNYKAKPSYAKLHALAM